MLVSNDLNFIAVSDFERNKLLVVLIQAFHFYFFVSSLFWFVSLDLWQKCNNHNDKLLLGVAGAKRKKWPIKQLVFLDKEHTIWSILIKFMCQCEHRLPNRCIDKQQSDNADFQQLTCTPYTSHTLYTSYTLYTPCL